MESVGGITIAFINKHVFAPVMTIFGETVNPDSLQPAPDTLPP